MNELLNYRKNITSQFGEDGLIETIFKKLGIAQGTCVEFGAWDGKFLSNTWNLWHNLGWKAVLIEGNSQKAQALAQSYQHLSNVTCLDSYVTAHGETSLDNLLSKTNIPLDFDLLSIDIDGNDVYVWKAVEKYKPKLVIIEHNPTIPPHLNLLHSPISGSLEGFGASVLAIQKLATEKGYQVVACTHCNSFCLRNDLVDKLDLKQDLILSNLFEPSGITYIVSSYNGRGFLAKHNGIIGDPSFVDTETLSGIYKQLSAEVDCPRETIKPVLLISGKLLETIKPYLIWFYKIFYKVYSYYQSWGKLLSKLGKMTNFFKPINGGY